MPYKSLPKTSFWKYCRSSDDFAVDQIFNPKFIIEPGVRIATAGSCFAQNIGHYLRASKAIFLDVETAPIGLSNDNKKRFGYDLFSGRFGNIYSVRQLRQLVEEVNTQAVRTNIVWERDGRYYDALRPSVEPNGLSSIDEVLELRRQHISHLHRLFSQTEVFIFTLGLTEMWVETTTGTVFPTCPGVIAGKFSTREFHFKNAKYGEIIADLTAAISLMRKVNPTMKFLLTVSPVPLVATATADHVLAATTYSKSTLRAVAGDIATQYDFVDYFPSYEIVSGAPQSSTFFETDLRQVNKTGISLVMAVFFDAFSSLLDTSLAFVIADNVSRVVASTSPISDQDSDNICEDILLEALSK